MKISSFPRVSIAPLLVPCKCMITPALFSSHKLLLPDGKSPRIIGNPEGARSLRSFLSPPSCGSPPYLPSLKKTEQLSQPEMRHCNTQYEQPGYPLKAEPGLARAVIELDPWHGPAR